MSTATKTQAAGQAAGHEAAEKGDKSKRLLEQILEQRFEYTPLSGETVVKMDARTVLKFFAKPTKKGAVCPEDQALKFCKLCEAQRLNPWLGEAYIVGYDAESGPEFSLITAITALLKRAEINSDYDGMECGVTVKGADGSLIDVDGELRPDGTVLLGGWARVFHKTKKVPTYRRIPLSERKKGTKTWNEMTAGMMCKCAKAAALREAFPSTCGGCYIGEEIEPSTESAAEPMVRRPTNQLAELTAGLEAAAKAKANGGKPAIESDLEREADAAFCQQPDAEPEYDPATGEMPIDDGAQAHANPLLDEAQLAFESVETIIDCRALETKWLAQVTAAEKSKISAMAHAAQQRIRGGRGAASNK